MPSLRGTVTEQNLKNAFAWESQANCRYFYFAKKADAEGFKDVAAVFRSTAESKTGHAHRYLEYLEEVGDLATGKPIGSTGDNLKAARRRDPRIHRLISGHGSRRRPGRLRRDRRLVRDAREGWEVACRPLQKGALTRFDLSGTTRTVRR